MATKDALFRPRVSNYPRSRVAAVSAFWFFASGTASTGGFFYG